MKKINKLLLILLLVFSYIYVNADTFYYPEIGGNGFGTVSGNCASLFGNNGVQIIHELMNIIRIAAVLIALINATLTLIPAVISKDKSELKKASSKLVTLAIVLAVIGIFPSIINIIASIFGYDVSCIF